MPKVGFNDFLSTIRGKYPNLKGYDETRLFTFLMQAGLEVEFDIDGDGNTMVSYNDITPALEEKIKQL
ncbi:MAG: hypothetical protein MN733_32500 [Nitrososphaera sp.]|nr:hypothetical protein [Nitrososphaera sp.]MCI0706178.1 hypothetical protein [Ignavibacteriota bacterium]